MGWLIFLGGSMFGGTMGVLMMCLVQINRAEDKADR